MINKIIASTIFFFMLVAISLSLAGITHVEMSKPFLAFLSSCNTELSSFRIAIPDIPYIPVEEIVTLDSGGEWFLQWFINFANGFFNFINFLITLINTLTNVINVAIQLIQFVFIVIKNLITMKNELIAQA